MTNNINTAANTTHNANKLCIKLFLFQLTSIEGEIGDSSFGEISNAADSANCVSIGLLPPFSAR